MGDGAAAAAVPDQLACVCEDQAEGGGGEAGQQRERGPGGQGLLPDEAVGEDAEVLGRFAEDEDDACGGAEVVGREDGDVRGSGGGGEREAEEREPRAG